MSIREIGSMTLHTGNQPFVHLFHTDGRNYAYDVNSNQILALEPVFSAVLDLFGSMSVEEMVLALKDEFQKEEILEAISVVDEARQDDGLFLGRQVELVSGASAGRQPGRCDTNLRHLVLTVTERCNLRCAYCLHGAALPWVRSHGTRDMSKETVLKAVQYYLDRSDPDHQPVVSFYGGEPLLVADLIFEVMDFAREHPRGSEILFAIDTNGVLLAEYAADLVRRENVHLQISLDGPRPIHDGHRRDERNNPSFDAIMMGLDQWLAADPEGAGRLSFVVTLTPEVDLAAVARFYQDFPPFARHGIPSQPQVRVNRADLAGQKWPGKSEGFKRLNSEIQEAQGTYLGALKNLQREKLSPVTRALFEPAIIQMHHRPALPLGDRFNPGGNCRPGIRKLHMDVDGTFQPCERTGTSLEIGGLPEGIDPAKVQELGASFHESVVTNCEHCWAVRLCGVCYAVQAASSGNPGPVPDSVCDSVRANRENTLKLLATILELPTEARAWLDESTVD